MFSRRRIVVAAAAVCGMALSPAPSRHQKITQPERSAILAALNQSRAGVHWDDGLPLLEWDPSLEAMAQAWAATCTGDSSGIGILAHNPNRNAGYSGSVGENISGWAVAPSDAPEVNLQNLVTLVNLWIEEGAKYDYGSNTCAGEPYSMRNDWKSCGHYTQVVAAATTKVGCGRSVCPNLVHKTTVVCNFSSSGNAYHPSTGVIARP